MILMEKSAGLPCAIPTTKTGKPIRQATSQALKKYKINK